MNLSAGAWQRVQNTKRDYVEQTTSDLRRYFARSLWLAPNNRYRSDTTRKVDEDFVQSGAFTPIKQANLAHYIASSAQMHCIDGWSYLASAISTLLRGDSFAAVHLAYYAELRAAMAIMATDGVGVLNYRHCALVGPNKAAELQGRMGTHPFAWESLQKWSEKTAAGDIISESITPFGIPLEAWFSTLPGSYTFQPLARSWIRTWGVDLMRLAHPEKGDRHARNEASYRPTGLSANRPVSAQDAIRVAGQFWEMCEPVGSSKFEKLDRRLLRSSVKAFFNGRNQIPASESNEDYRTFVTSLVGAQSIGSDKYRLEIVEYLTATEDGGVEDIVHLAKAKISHPDLGHLGVISRAFLLLRLASGTVDTTLRIAGVREDDLRFWKNALMSERGIGDPDSPPEEMGDFWKDVDDGLIDIRDRLKSGQDLTLSSMRPEFDDALFKLAGFDAVPLWAIARV